MGKYLYIMPDNDADMVTVIGKPIQFPTIADPSVEDVTKYHALYRDSLVDLFNRYKGRYATGGEAAELEIL